MKPEDDPEARIRELERPLAETAHASEIGDDPQAPGGYTPPPGPAAPPPALYGGSFPQTSPRSSSRLRWILIGIFIIVPIAFAGIIAVNTAQQISRGGGTTLSPTQTPRAAPSTLPTAGPLPPAGGNLSVNNVNGNQTLRCNDSIVTVSGACNRVLIQGHCKSLTVSGVQNTITVDTVDTIEISGFDNRVSYHAGSPGIDKSGVQNVVKKG